MAGWVDKRMRIPLFGILAIVVIVALVAVLLKTQMQTLFPDSTFAIQQEVGEGETNVIGRAGLSFEGVREFPLTMKEVLRGTLQRPDGSLTFAVDSRERYLVITKDGALREEILLEQREDGSLTASFEYDSVQTRIDVFASQNLLEYSLPGVSSGATAVALSTVPVHAGRFLYDGTWHLFEFFPHGGAATITGVRVSRVLLSEQAGGEYHGVWRDGASHPVTVDLHPPAIARIEELW